MIDLHTHSTCSDGSLTPVELIRAAAGLGITALALTDHDTVDGLDEAAIEAGKAGVRFVPGIELDVEFSPGQLHLLGLGLEFRDREFRHSLAELRAGREQRNALILDRIRESGIKAEYREIEAKAGGRIVGRPHFARFLVDRGVAGSIKDAFLRFLRPGAPFYAEKPAFPVADAVRMIRSANGRPVIAHPLSLYLSWGALPDRLRELKEAGVEGIEAWQSGATERECRRLEEIAAGLGLFVTGGSDFHGESRPDRKLGRTAGGIRIEDRFLESL